MSVDSDKVRSMADLLKSGATLTDLSCPACSAPLFRLKNGDLWCAQCQKKVVVVKGDEQVEATQSLTALGSVESTLLAKIREVNERIKNENEIEKLQGLSAVMGALLDNLERVKKMGRHRA